VIAMASNTISIKVTVRWWLLYAYVGGARLFCAVFGTKPDEEKAARFVVRWCLKIAPSGA